MPKYTFYQ